MAASARSPADISGREGRESHTVFVRESCPGKDSQLVQGLHRSVRN